MQEIFVGRQPIYNKTLGVFGYEMLFRDGDNNEAKIDELSGEGATSTTIQNVFLELGLEKLVGSNFAFINMPESFLLSEELIPFPPEQVVLEVLEDVKISPELIVGVKRLKDQGFTVALDDYIYNPEHKPLIELVDIVKIDITLLDRKEIKEHVKILRKYKVKLLAEKIENMDEFDFCVELGFDYYQGFFLGVPRIVSGESLPANKLGIMSLLAVTHNPNSEADEIADAISRDVTISYKMLKLVNSSFFNLSRKIEAVKEVVVLLGRAKLASWASVMALASMDDKPAEMIRMSLIRAKMCELLAKSKGEKALDTYFTVGMFSALDVLMERSLPKLINPLPLAENVKSAILDREGSLGEMLDCAIASERAHFEYINSLGFKPSDLFAANIDAIEWADGVLGAIA